MERALRVIVPAIALLALVAATALPAEAGLPLQRKRCGALITSSFRLKNELACTGDGLRIGANGITIDLNGKEISGDGGEGDYGIDNSAGYDRVTIMTNSASRRSVITDFYNGIQVGRRANRMTIKRVNVFPSEHDGIKIEGGNGHRLEKFKVAYSRDEGVELLGNGSVIIDGWVGISIDIGIKVEGDGNEVVGMDVLSNGSGLSVSGDLNTIEFNVVEENREVGIFIDGYRNDVNHNKLCGNPGTQIVDEGEQTRLGRNQVAKDCPE